MESIYSFLSKHMNGMIVILGFMILFFMIMNSFRLWSHYKNIKSVLNWKNTRSVINKNTREVEDQSESEKVTPDTIRELQTEFNKECSFHEVLAQLIPIFPLFGILGTVAGIILQLRSQDIDSVFSSLDLALGSTFWGLVAAIILKAIDAVFSSRFINDTEIILDDYDKKFNNAIKLGNISE